LELQPKTSIINSHHPLYGKNLAQQTQMSMVFAGRNFRKHCQLPKKNIVIAILDSGINYQLPDIYPFVLINEAEIQGPPDRDADNNGFHHDVFWMELCS
jgi:hypothetical protein